MHLWPGGGGKGDILSQNLSPLVFFFLKDHTLAQKTNLLKRFLGWSVSLGQGVGGAKVIDLPRTLVP